MVRPGNWALPPLSTQRPSQTEEGKFPNILKPSFSSGLHFHFSLQSASLLHRPLPPTLLPSLFLPTALLPPLLSRLLSSSLPSGLGTLVPEQTLGAGRI